MSGRRPPEGVPFTAVRQYRRCTLKRNCPRCRSGPGHGPYWYVYWREAGASRTGYAGLARPEGAAAYREQGRSGARMSGRVPTPEPEPGLHVQTLGKFVVWVGNQEITNRLLDAPDALCCLVLLLTKARPRLAMIPRASMDEVTEVLYPAQDPDAPDPRRIPAALGALVKILRLPHSTRSLVRVVGRGTDRFVELRPTAYGEPPANWFDALRFEEVAAIAERTDGITDLERALAYYGGPFLEGLAAGAPTTERRVHLQRIHRRLGERLAERLILETRDALFRAFEASPADSRLARRLIVTLIGLEQDREVHEVFEEHRRVRGGSVAPLLAALHQSVYRPGTNPPAPSGAAPRPVRR
ncbi:MAG: AfsR/SARP family transcriptional regulator [Chloroflexota bacterium]